jgi:hypothetical protein
MVDIKKTGDEARQLMRHAADILRNAARGSGAFVDPTDTLTEIIIAVTAIESAQRLLRAMGKQP